MSNEVCGGCRATSDKHPMARTKQGPVSVCLHDRRAMARRSARKTGPGLERIQKMDAPSVQMVKRPILPPKATVANPMARTKQGPVSVCLHDRREMARRSARKTGQGLKRIQKMGTPSVRMVKRPIRPPKAAVANPMARTNQGPVSVSLVTRTTGQGLKPSRRRIPRKVMGMSAKDMCAALVSIRQCMKPTD